MTGTVGRISLRKVMALGLFCVRFLALKDDVSYGSLRFEGKPRLQKRKSYGKLGVKAT
jgi:hypothetical protein